MEYRYKTAERLNDRQAKSLLSRVIYSVEGIAGCVLEEETQDLVFQVTDEQSLPQLEATLERLVLQEQKLRHLTSRVLRETEPSQDAIDVDARRLDVETVFAKDGHVRRDEAVQVMWALQEYFKNLACKHDVELRYYPTMMKREALEPCNYIETFPQNLFFVSEFPHQLPVLEQVKETDNMAALTRPSEWVMTPAQCFHSYAELEGQVLDGPVILTSQGTCFRHETPWRVGNQRMNEFVLREILFVGSPEFVDETRRAIMEDAWQTFLDFGLHGRIETALDPFYFAEDTAKGTVQLMRDMKCELVVSVNGGQDQYAVSSFNDMRDSLCKAYRIHDPNGKPWSSGCVGFGIERWLYALLSTHGTDLNAWPSRVRELLGLAKKEAGALATD